MKPRNTLNLRKKDALGLGGASDAGEDDCCIELLLFSRVSRISRSHLLTLILLEMATKARTKSTGQICVSLL